MRGRTLQKFMGLMKNDLENVTVRLFDADAGIGVDTPYIGGLRPYVLEKYGNYYVIETELFYDGNERYCDIDVSQEVNYGY